MSTLIGLWLYASLIYQGQPIPRPDEKLIMHFIFNNSTENEILYHRQNETGFCRRTAKYSVVNDQLIQEVIAVDPLNAPYCSEDTDMRIGFKSVSKFEVKGDEMYLYLPLGEEEIIYVWKRQAAESSD